MGRSTKPVTKMSGNGSTGSTNCCLKRKTGHFPVCLCRPGRENSPVPGRKEVWGSNELFNHVWNPTCIWHAVQGQTLIHLENACPACCPGVQSHMAGKGGGSLWGLRQACSGHLPGWALFSSPICLHNTAGGEGMGSLGTPGKVWWACRQQTAAGSRAQQVHCWGKGCGTMGNTETGIGTIHTQVWEGEGGTGNKTMHRQVIMEQCLGGGQAVNPQCLEVRPTSSSHKEGSN